MAKDNTMSDTPTFFWIAKLKDGNILKQFEDNGQIRHFREDILPFSTLFSAFFLQSMDGKKRYGVNLETGDFLFDKGYLSDLGVKFARHPNVEYPIEPPLRPIFFRRVTRQVDISGKDVVEPLFVYAIGWQATIKIPVLNKGDKQWHEEEVNVKHILYIHPNGELTFA